MEVLDRVKVQFVGESDEKWVPDTDINVDKGAEFTVRGVYSVKWNTKILRIEELPAPNKQVSGRANAKGAAGLHTT